MITDYQYRKSWSLFPTGVSVLATKNNNQFFGMTANSIMSISLDPKIIMVSVGNNRTIIEYLKKDKEASVSILSKDQIDRPMNGPHPISISKELYNSYKIL